MCSISMPQSMCGYFFDDTRFFNCLAYYPLRAALGQALTFVALKEPLAGMLGLQIFCNATNKHIAHWYIAVLATFAVFYMYHTTLQVNIANGELAYFCTPQPAAINSS